LTAVCAERRNFAARRAAIFALLGLFAGSAWPDAQPPGESAPAPAPARAEPKQAGADTLETVEIRARRAALEKQVKTFVSHITAGSWNETLVRWNGPICPYVAGLTRSHGEYVVARLEQVARAVGAKFGAEHCRVNLYIVATSDPDKLLRLWRKRDPTMFNDRRGGGGRPDFSRIDKFLKTARPVRVWCVASGQAASSGEPSSGSFGGKKGEAGLVGFGGASIVNDSASRLTFHEVLSTSLAYVVIDSNRIAGLKLGQLTDYIAMTTFTELNPDADLGSAPTILRLFAASASGQEVPAGLTAWDQSFLKALYETRQASTQQRIQIVQKVVRELAP
jgi:hypothetical protein